MSVSGQNWERGFFRLGSVIEVVLRPFLTVHIDVQAPLPEGPILMAANHHSFVDMLVSTLCCCRLKRPARLIVSRAFFTKPGFGRVLRNIGCIAGGRKSGADVVAAEAIRSGVSVAIMPEGKVTVLEPGHTLAPLLPGVASIWSATACPFVAVGISGADAVWPKGRLPRRPRRKAHRPIVYVRVAEADRGAEGLRTLDRVTEIMEANCVASEASRLALAASLR